MISDELISEFVKTFYGYGDLSADIWFIGMEEGGGGSVEDIQSRLRVWDDRNRKQVEDLAEYHVALGYARLFTGSNPPLQKTWSKLIRAQMIAEGKECGTQAIRAHQRDRLGRLGSGTCLLELMPLPSPGTSTWLYDKFSDNPDLQTRKRYFQTISPARIIQISELIARRRPRNVVFFGKSYSRTWRTIAGPEVNFIDTPDFSEATGSDTNYFITRHPTSFGVQNSNWDRLGLRMKELS